MIKPEKHIHEKERQALLDSYSILDTLPETDFDNLTAIASQICGIPISLITLLDKDRQWFKSRHGIEETETERENAFCAHAIHDANNVFIVEDARKDIRFHDNPLVTGDPNVIFYAGVPLTNSLGLPLGTLCVIDNKPNVLSQTQLKALKSLADQVMNLLELRKSKQNLEDALFELEENNRELERFAYIAAHDLKSPLNNISSLSGFLKDEYATKIDNDGKLLIDYIQTSSDELRSLIDGMLEYSKSSKLIQNTKSKINLEELKQTLTALFSFENKFTINLISELTEIDVNKTVIDQILINLAGNAIKYNNKNVTEVTLVISNQEDQYQFVFTDNGPGIAAEHHDKIFQIFETLNTEDRFGQKGNGIGLATVKKLVENLGGKISVTSQLGKGTSFHFTINK